MGRVDQELFVVISTAMASWSSKDSGLVKAGTVRRTMRLSTWGTNGRLQVAPRQPWIKYGSLQKLLCF